MWSVGMPLKFSEAGFNRQNKFFFNPAKQAKKGSNPGHKRVTGMQIAIAWPSPISVFTEIIVLKNKLALD